MNRIPKVKITGAEVACNLLDFFQNEVDCCKCHFIN